MNEFKAFRRRLRLRFRRGIRKQRRQVEDITVQADDSLNRLVFKRLDHLVSVRRFVLTWVLLLVFVGVGAVWQVRGLEKFYLEFRPVAGGTYREGIIGTFTTSNPLFAVTSVDTSAAQLVYSGLFRISPDGSFEPELATSLAVDEKASTYTVTLRDNVRWHDGELMNADDVVFTYELIKNPDTRSPLFSSWQSIVVSKVDDRTVQFVLPNTLASFQYSLTNGIVPEHVLRTVEPSTLRSDDFGTVGAVGTGRFKMDTIEVLETDRDNRQEKITLQRNEAFYGVVPKIDSVVLRTYADEDSLLSAFDSREISAMVGLQSMPDSLMEDTIQSFSTPLRSSVMAFMNNNSLVLKDKKVRQALTHATNSEAVREAIGYQVLAVDSPFLKNQFPYNPEKVQLSFDVDRANGLLDEAGWLKGPDGRRQKDGATLNLRLVSQSLTEYASVTRSLQEQWNAVGVSVEALLLPEQDLQSGPLAQHDYDVLVYGIAIGNDPDVYPYWHTSQADPRLKTRLNLSEYSNKIADEALESGRTRLDQQLRTIKYAPFLDVWRDDSPAVALYQPRFLYVVRGTFDGYRSGQFNIGADRYYSVSDWLIRREKDIKQ